MIRHLPTVVRCLVGLMAIASGVACDRTALPFLEAETMHVELDLFSGRPNPSWELTPTEGASFLQQLRALPRTVAAPPEGGLGYRGLIVTATAGTLIDSFTTVVVSGGLVIGRHPTGDTQAWLDTDRRLEQWLALTGKPHLDPDIYAQVTHAI